MSGLTKEDRNLREKLEERYKNLIVDWIPETNQSYYDKSISIGVDNKFGNIPPGYFLLPKFCSHFVHIQNVNNSWKKLFMFTLVCSNFLSRGSLCS